MTTALPGQLGDPPIKNLDRQIAVQKILGEHLTALAGTHPDVLRAIPAIVAALAPHLSHDTGSTRNAPQISEREREVLQLAANGCDNPQIGLALHITADTAKTHLQRIYRKLGAHNRPQAVNIAWQTGIFR